jgi:chromosome segregation protein
MPSPTPPTASTPCRAATTPWVRRSPGWSRRSASPRRIATARRRNSAGCARARDAESHTASATTKLTELTTNWSATCRLEEVANERLEAAGERLAESEARLDAWQDSGTRCRQLRGPTEQAQTERGRINNLEQRMQHQAQREARVEQELGRWTPRSWPLAGAAGGALGRARRADRRRRGRADRDRRCIAAARRGAHAVAARLDAARTELQTCRGRQASLEALQDAALEAATMPSRLDRAPAAADVSAPARRHRGGRRLGASGRGGARRRSARSACRTSMQTPRARLRSLMLLGRLRGAPDPEPDADSLLRGCAALAAGRSARRHRCRQHPRRGAGTARPARPGERIVTRDGSLIGRDWLRSARRRSAWVAGSIGRAEELRALQTASDELEQVIATCRAAGCRDGRAAPRTGAGARGRPAAASLG